MQYLPADFNVDVNWPLPPDRPEIHISPDGTRLILGSTSPVILSMEDLAIIHQHSDVFDRVRDMAISPYTNVYEAYLSL